jgi:hypothetical protein
MNQLPQEWQKRAKEILIENHVDSQGHVCRHYNSGDIITSMAEIASEMQEAVLKVLDDYMIVPESLKEAIQNIKPLDK